MVLPHLRMVWEALRALKQAKNVVRDGDLTENLCDTRRDYE